MFRFDFTTMDAVMMIVDVGREVVVKSHLIN